MAEKIDDVVLPLVIDADDLIGGLDKTKDALDDVTKSAEELGDKGTDALKKTEAEAKKTAAALKSGFGEAQQRLEFVTNSIGALATSFAATSDSASEFSAALQSVASGAGQVASAASAGAAAFGPWGAAIGGAISAITQLNDHLQGLEQAHNEAARAARSHRIDLERLGAQINASRHMEQLEAGLLSVQTQTEALTAAQLRLDAERVRTIDAEEQVIELTRRRRDAAIAVNTALEEGRRISQGNTSEIRDARRAYESLSRQLVGARADVVGFGVSLETQQAQVINLASALRTAEIIERETAENTERLERRRAAGQAHAIALQRERQRLDDIWQAQQDEFYNDAWQEVARLNREFEATGDIISEVTQIQMQARTQLAAFETSLNESLEASHIQSVRRRTRIMLTEWNRVTTQQMLALTEYQTATTQFRDAWAGSQEQLIAGFRNINRLAAQTGRQVSTSLDLISASLEQTGNQALKSLGEDFAGAFAQAVTAAIIGAQDFGDAMILMTQALLEQLTQQAIVQAIVQLASGLGAIARREYDAAAMHFASMAAWVAVGAAAGIGLAVVSPEAAKVRASQDASADATRAEEKDRQKKQNDSQDGGGPGSVTFIFNDKPFATRDELQQMLRRENQQITRQFGNS